jgi:hypothetical protein
MDRRLMPSPKHALRDAIPPCDRGAGLAWALSTPAPR